MNRKKKINQILKAKQKKQNAKLHKSNKPRYISKAERAKMEAEEQEQGQSPELTEQTPKAEVTRED
ncbi:DUF2986 domain-containing protein [Vibrio sp. B1FLJ16]|uniref:DUF2986 domain-containing protein n=1 Tax=Vibrio sp. B1FLJ16 TaxID=2751178 RepID=UPI0015F73810|nr:DUF2986 domain-containing protein [Vibrio sp. B1FLJ16]MCA0937519.1 DUF2986 domain-containing protein [Vibrio alginolyticus]CAD7819707.1 hypothetical protein ACOMICROBIO_EPCKBFOG_03701 [Vibrio sp. B1FLJ16]CAD7820790.1 hypothetical protein ACOMICROBIO_FLGHMIGD_04242 [Vibrio sp. B1FLJ16]CAE6940217.1 hypothetical protein ACOMICROBIO_EPCKBFOG_03701 [Vibrio sp. B1FLJ16]CAE6944249.1 hypothetical protein ACOMICROBIO_FLGHMIGD_04242 [Vibrio sp. B1FLJ16]